MKLTRRQVLRGIGGATLTLPFLESFARPNRACAQDAVQNSFAIFFRQANGVACAQNTEVGAEPERFWPTEFGALSAATVQGRALDELTDHLAELLVVRGVNMQYFDYGDGHARGAMQGLTARGPVVPAVGGESEAAGESIDHRIGAELNAAGRDSLFMYAGPGGGWLGGACISYRGSGERRAAYHNPSNAYDAVAGVRTMEAEQAELLRQRRTSLNDLVRDQLAAILRHPRLGEADRRRLDLHLTNIRDIETQLSCRMDADREAVLDGLGGAYESSDGDQVFETVKLQMDIAAAAVACGYTRSVALQVGSGNDGSTRYRNLSTGTLMPDNYHFVSHRRASHDASGAIIAGSDLLHHHVDRQFASAFAHLVSRLKEYEMPDGSSLLDAGVSVWYNDNGNGPGHSGNDIPCVVAGSGGGFLRTGEAVQLNDGGSPNHHRLLATLANAAGVRNADGSPFDSFGDPSLGGGTLDALHR